MLALGGFGASCEGDGESFVSMSQQNIMDMSVESIEEDHPVVVLGKEFVADTGGPGEHRGGVGVVYDRMLTADADVYPMPLHLRILPWGSNDGAPGRPGGAWIGDPDTPNPDIPNPDIPNPDIPNPDIPNPDIPNPDAPNPDAPNPDAPAWARTWLGADPPLRPLGGYFDASGQVVGPDEGQWRCGLADIAARPGTLFRVRTPGAGGWGPATSRDPQAVLRDVRDGYVSIAGARTDYSVVVIGDPAREPESLQVDDAATDELRGGHR
jgi:N-methylhydantoinase B